MGQQDWSKFDPEGLSWEDVGVAAWNFAAGAIGSGIAAVQGAVETGAGLATFLGGATTTPTPAGVTAIPDGPALVGAAVMLHGGITTVKGLSGAYESFNQGLGDLGDSKATTPKPTTDSQPTTEPVSAENIALNKAKAYKAEGVKVGVWGGMTTPGGLSFDGLSEGVSDITGESRVINDEVADMIKNCPDNLKDKYPGACVEPHLFSQAKDAGVTDEELAGSEMASVNNWGANRFKDPCSCCGWLMDQYKIKSSPKCIGPNSPNYVPPATK